MIKGNATSEVKNVFKYDQLEVLSINSTHEVTHAVLKYIFFACTLYRTIDFRLSYTSLRLSFCDRSWTDKRSPVINLLIPLGWVLCCAEKRLKCVSWVYEGDVTQWRFATTIFIATQRCCFEQCCNHSKQCCNNVVMLCCVKNRRYKSSRVTSP